MIRVLIIDDSAVARRALSQALAKETDIEVVGTAPDPYVARELIASQNPDVLTLDLEMPRMDGLTFLRQLMKHHPIPTIVVSSISQKGSAKALEALSAGAFDVIGKPSDAQSRADLGAQLAEKVRAAAVAQVAQLGHAAAEASLFEPHRTPLVPAAVASIASRPPAPPTPMAAPFATPLASPLLAGSGHPIRLIAIGASTGGTVAIERVLTQLPPDCPPVVVVQHMPVGFTRSFAERLDRLCRIRVSEAVDGEPLGPGCAVIAPGNRHLLLQGTEFKPRVALSDAEHVNRHRPAVDVLFNSVAKLMGPAVAAALLTGMGADGAVGLLTLRKVGARTIAQDQESCVVFGMPREAIELGAAEQIVPLNQVASALLALVHQSAARGVA